MTRGMDQGSTVCSPEEVLTVVSWTGGVFDYELPPFPAPADVRLLLTSGADGKQAMSAELSFLAVPVYEEVNVIKTGKRKVQSFRYRSPSGWEVDFGYCGNCGWSCSNLLLHIKTKKPCCEKCGGEVSWRPCLRHHTFGECSLCALPTLPGM